MEGSEKDKYIYNREIVQKTMQSLENVDILKENIIQKLVDKIYADGYVGKDKEEFDRVHKHFESFSRQIVPFINDSESEMEFYSLFQSYEVVPFKYKFDYLDEIDEGKYYIAMSYFLSISMGQFRKLEKEGNIELDAKTYFVDVKYDNKLV